MYTLNTLDSETQFEKAIRHFNDALENRKLRNDIESNLIFNFIFIILKYKNKQLKKLMKDSKSKWLKILYFW